MEVAVMELTDTNTSPGGRTEKKNYEVIYKRLKETDAYLT